MSFLSTAHKCKFGNVVVVPKQSRDCCRNKLFMSNLLYYIFKNQSPKNEMVGKCNLQTAIKYFL